MKIKILVIMFMTMFITGGVSFAAEDKASPVIPATSPSLGAQAGEAARELKGTAGETLATGAVKVADSSKKVEAEVQDTLKTLQEQWDVLAKQLQEKTRQIQKQLEQQWQDFNKSFNKPQ